MSTCKPVHSVPRKCNTVNLLQWHWLSVSQTTAKRVHRREQRAARRLDTLRTARDRAGSSWWCARRPPVSGSPAAPHTRRRARGTGAAGARPWRPCRATRRRTRRAPGTGSRPTSRGSSGTSWTRPDPTRRASRCPQRTRRSTRRSRSSSRSAAPRAPQRHSDVRSTSWSRSMICSSDWIWWANWSGDAAGPGRGGTGGGRADSCSMARAGRFSCTSGVQRTGSGSCPGMFARRARDLLFQGLVGSSEWYELTCWTNYWPSQ